MKKLSTLFLALVATTALWAADFEVDGIAYNQLGGDSVEVTSKSPDYSGTITIPASVTYNSTTYRVTRIGYWAFASCDSLNSVIIPNSITSIEENAFGWCTSLSSVTIPNSVISIGDWAFYKCTSLSSITIPNSVTSIGDYAFKACTSLNSITIGNSVISIGEWAFDECTSLSSITIPNSVTSIGYYAFSGCTSLPVENNLRYADTYLVGAVGKTLSTYTIKEDTKWIGDWAFNNCSTLSSITIPNSVTSIGEVAFSECTSLSTITIPNSVTSIGGGAFDECASLTAINVDAANTHYISVDGALFNYAKDTLIQYPIGNTRTSYTIPSSVTSIGDGAFRSCTSLSSITIPNSVTSIGEVAFYKCTSLSTITIPNSVTSIGNETFYGCTSLNSITIPNSVKSIGWAAFSKCTSLTSITCYAITPPSCGIYCFNNIDKTIPLYVPEGSVDAYKTANEWKDFTNIQAVTTDIKNVNANENANANQKVMKDGHLLILHNNHTYTATGTELW